ncbi:hypothetical protein ACFLS9_01265 [Bacteroidota bacterium]
MEPLKKYFDYLKERVNEGFILLKKLDEIETSDETKVYEPDWELHCMDYKKHNYEIEDNSYLKIDLSDVYQSKIYNDDFYKIRWFTDKQLAIYSNKDAKVFCKKWNSEEYKRLRKEYNKWEERIKSHVQEKMKEFYSKVISEFDLWFDKNRLKPPKQKSSKQISRKTKDLEQDAKIYIDSFIKFKKNPSNKGKRFTFRKLQALSDNHLEFSTWSTRVQEKEFLVQIEIQVDERRKSDRKLSEETINIYDALLKRNYKYKLTAIIKQEEKEKKRLESAKYKEKRNSEIKRLTDEDGNKMGFDETYTNKDPNPYSPDADDSYEKLEENIDD